MMQLSMYQYLNVLLLLLAKSTSPTVAQRSTQRRATVTDTFCEDDEELAKLEFLLDPKAEETGWRLECDGNLIWDAAPGSLLGKHNTWITEIACVNVESTCNFIVHDIFGDGLSDGGWYTLIYGARTIATYDHESSPQFLEDTSCFGPGCYDETIETTGLDSTDDATTPQQQEYDCPDGEELAILDIMLDENPIETGWKLNCDKSEYNVFDTPSGFILDAEPYSWIEEHSCISTQSTCSFTMYDSGGDGLLGDGWYALRFGATTIAAYEFATNVPFRAETVCFGPSCDVPPLELEDDYSTSTSTEHTNDESTTKSITDGSSFGNEMSKSDKFLLVGFVVGFIVTFMLVVIAIVLVRSTNRYKKEHESAFKITSKNYPELSKQNLYHTTI